MLEMADLRFPAEMTGNRYEIEILIRVMKRISGFVLRRWPRRFMFILCGSYCLKRFAGMV